MTSIEFTDSDSGDEAVVVVQSTGEAVGLTVSLRQDGDVSVLMPTNKAEELIAALIAATKA